MRKRYIIFICLIIFFVMEKPVEAQENLSNENEYVFTTIDEDVQTSIEALNNKLLENSDIMQRDILNNNIHIKTSDTVNSIKQSQLNYSSSKIGFVDDFYKNRSDENYYLLVDYIKANGEKEYADGEIVGYTLAADLGTYNQGLCYMPQMDTIMIYEEVNESGIYVYSNVYFSPNSKNCSFYCSAMEYGNGNTLFEASGTLDVATYNGNLKNGKLKYKTCKNYSKLKNIKNYVTLYVGTDFLFNESYFLSPILGLDYNMLGFDNYENGSELGSIVPISMTIQNAPSQLFVGKEGRIGWFMKYRGGGSINVGFASSNPDVISIDSVTGDYTAISPGKATLYTFVIKATGDVNTKYVKKKLITVKSPQKLSISTKIELNKITAGYKNNKSGKYVGMYLIPYDKSTMGSGSAMQKYIESKIDSGEEIAGAQMLSFEADTWSNFFFYEFEPKTQYVLYCRNVTWTQSSVYYTGSTKLIKTK